MKKNFLTLTMAICLLTLSSFVISKTSSTNLDNNKITYEEESSFYYVLDNRYKGGSDAFIEVFSKNVKYPSDAMDNCRVGLSKVKFTINKDGKFESLKFSNPLEFGIEKALEDFFKSIEGEWKAWARSSEMEMTVGWAVVSKKDSYYPDADLVVKRVPTYKWSSDDASCAADAKNDKKIKKYLKKKKYAKALPFVEEMLRRHPDNAVYIDNMKFIKMKIKSKK